MSDPILAGAILTIDLDALAANWRLLADRVAPAACAAVVKADAYGTGIERVAPALAAAGCATFFVALPDEGVRLRVLLSDAEICVFGGAPRGAEDVFARHRLVPVLNSLGDIEAWSAFARTNENPATAMLHIDTGMSRLGLPPDELGRLADEPDRLDGVELRAVLSHLACADEPDHPMNRRQLDAFRTARDRLPTATASFANSSGIFLGPDFHFDLGRPGIAIYGSAPAPDRPNPMAQVVQLQGKILQVREIDSPQTVGYGATHRAGRRERIATIAMGYADGYLRSLSNSGTGYVGDVPVPVVGRVSMDLITFDVTALPESEARPGAFIDLISPHNPIDAVAAQAGTISYEILTSLGARYHRVYTGGDGAARS